MQVGRQAGLRSDAEIVTKAVLRAAEKLGLSNKVLAAVLGMSGASASRMGKGAYRLAGKEFELAVLLIRLYRSLDAIMGGDEAASKAWLRNPNLALQDAPLAHIQSVSGLMHVINYLDARRAVV